MPEPDLYGEPNTKLREIIVGGFIVDMKKIGMANCNDEKEKRVQLEATSRDSLELLEGLINYHKNVMGV